MYRKCTHSFACIMHFRVRRLFNKKQFGSMKKRMQALVHFLSGQCFMIRQPTVRLHKGISSFSIFCTEGRWGRRELGLGVPTSVYYRGPSDPQFTCIPHVAVCDQAKSDCLTSPESLYLLSQSMTSLILSLCLKSPSQLSPPVEIGPKFQALLSCQPLHRHLLILFISSG